MLEEAGLVSKRRQGREQRVLGRREAIARAQRLLDEYEQLWRARLARIDDILDDDTDGGTA